MNKGRKITYEERLEIIQNCIAQDNKCQEARVPTGRAVCFQMIRRARTCFYSLKRSSSGNHPKEHAFLLSYLSI